MGKKVVDPEKRNKKAVALYKKGLSMLKVGIKLKINPSLVGYILKKYTCESRPLKRNLLGKRISKLVVIGTAKNRGHHTYWLCRCDCGIVKEVISSSLMRGQKSCGCLKGYLKHGECRRGKETKRYILWQAAKSRAKKKGLVFNLKIEDVLVPKYCPVLGIKLKFNKIKQKYNSPSLDRLISSKGYTKENCRVISYKANAMKQTATLDEVKKLANWLEKELK